jgi:hypothetical protein
MFHLPSAFFVVLIVANFFSLYLSWKEILIFVALFVVSFFIPSPFSIVLVVILDLVLLVKFKQEHF